MASTKIVLIIEYDGVRYHGFQLQVNQSTIQGKMEKAIWELTGEKCRVRAASRTDAGVHAKGQVVEFKTWSSISLQKFTTGLNYYLPKDIAVKAAYKVDDSFNVRRDAISREYNYYILNRPTRSPLRAGFCYLVSGDLDVEMMNQACQALVGEHDFASFVTSVGSEVNNTWRTVYKAEMGKANELTIFNMVANSFLIHQVRNTIGALIRVGLGKMTTGDFRSIMYDRIPGSAWPTAPACGLCLMQVNYSGPSEWM